MSTAGKGWARDFSALLVPSVRAVCKPLKMCTCSTPGILFLVVYPKEMCARDPGTGAASVGFFLLLVLKELWMNRTAAPAVLSTCESCPVQRAA